MRTRLVEMEPKADQLGDKSSMPLIRIPSPNNQTFPSIWKAPPLETILRESSMVEFIINDPLFCIKANLSMLGLVLTALNSTLLVGLWVGIRPLARLSN